MTDVNSKIFNIFIHIQLFFERTHYGSFNDLKSRSKASQNFTKSLQERKVIFNVDEV
jgi:hypothetical protein